MSLTFYTAVVPSSKPVADRKYHHGDLRAALVQATTDIVSEAGLGAFSVAAAARRAGVSSGAPFRHFADAEALLVAAAVTVSELMTVEYEKALASQSDPVEQLAALAAAYVRFAARHGAVFDLVFAPSLRGSRDDDLVKARRQLPDLVLPVVREVTPNVRTALELMEAHIALSHGYAVLLRDGFVDDANPQADATADRCAEAARRLIRSYL